MSAPLPIHRVEKIWGRDVLPQPFTCENGTRIGEIWFEPPAQLPDLLVKYLFSSDRLSVQVHPDDARAPEGARGKEECWYILDAEPGAALAIGLEREMPVEEVRAAALDGSIEGLLTWHDVARGDFFYLPAGTIHAIGPGISLIEVQQNSDITYRLFDYGRPRDLHLEQALQVATCGPYSSTHRQRVADTGEVALVTGPRFRLHRIDGVPGSAARPAYRGKLLLIPLSEGYAAAGETVAAGSCVLVDDVEQITCLAPAQALIAQPL